MATFLDLTLIDGLSAVFIFIFVWIAVYGVLTVAKPFGDNKTGLYAFIGLCLALLTLFSGPVLNLIRFMIPWFVGVMIFVVLMFMILFAVGYDLGQIQEVIKGDDYGVTVTSWVIVISVIILLGGVGFIFFSGDNFTQGTETADQGSISLGDQEAVGDRGADALFATIFHPRILGLIVILVIGWITIFFLAKST